MSEGRHVEGEANGETIDGVSRESNVDGQPSGQGVSKFQVDGYAIGRMRDEGCGIQRNPKEKWPRG